MSGYKQKVVIRSSESSSLNPCCHHFHHLAKTVYSCLHKGNNTTRFFYISNTYKKQKSAKIKQKLSDTLRLNFCYLIIIHMLHPRYHPKIIGHAKEQVCLHLRDYTINYDEIKMKMKNRLHR